MFFLSFVFLTLKRQKKSGKKLVFSMKKYTRQDIPYFVSHLPTVKLFSSVEQIAPTFNLAVSSISLI